MRILSFDPGGTTGAALYDTAADRWERRELTGDHHKALYEFMWLYEPDVVIYERFNYQRRDVTKGVSLRLDSVEYIGVIKLAKQLAHAGVAEWEHDFVLIDQQPSVRMWWTDDRLKKLGLWTNSPHERDATRHLLYYITQGLKERSFVERLK